MERRLEIPEEEADGRGYMFYGCLILVALFALGAGILSITGYYAYKGIGSYLEERPRTVTTDAISEEQFAALERDLLAFLAAARRGLSATIRLDARQINSLLAHNPLLTQVNGTASVAIEGDTIRATASIPLRFGWVTKYLNGSAAVRAGTRNGVAFASITDLELKGKRIPSDAMDRIGKFNLLEAKYEEDGQQKDLLPVHVANISIANGEVLIATTAGKPAG